MIYICEWSEITKTILLHSLFYIQVDMKKVLHSGKKIPFFFRIYAFSGGEGLGNARNVYFIQFDICKRVCGYVCRFVWNKTFVAAVIQELMDARNLVCRWSLIYDPFALVLTSMCFSKKRWFSAFLKLKKIFILKN